jgi:C-terminal peptidase prc
MKRGAVLAVGLWGSAQLFGATPLDDLLDVLGRHGHDLREPARAAALFSAVARVADPGAAVFDAAGRTAWEERERGLLYQLGARFSASNGVLSVVEILPASPALAAGLQTRATLVAVDGLAVASNRIDSVLALLRRDAAGSVRLEWKAPDGNARKASVELARLAETPAQLQEILPGGFGYLRLHGLHAGSGDWLARLLLKWEKDGCSGIILDLRDAEGGDLEAALRLAGLFARADSPLVTLRPRAGEGGRQEKAAAGEKLSLPVLALINGRTRGAAEVLAAALQRSGQGAMLVGEPTAGDPLVREFVEASPGLHLRLATRVLEFGDGTRLDGTQSLTPDVRVLSPDLAAVDEEPEWDFSVGERARTPDPEALARAARIGRDAVLQRGVDILLGLKALNIRVAERLGAPRS